LTASLAHPREVFKPALVSNAAAIVCGHNHPSGDPQPSQEDRVITRRLVAAGQLLGITVLDHLIVGDGTAAYYSFADAGALEETPRC
jgi:DNA repair protein RadC